MIPGPIRAALRVVARPLRAIVAAVEQRRLARALGQMRPAEGHARVAYLSPQFPARPGGEDALVRGGAVKLRHLDAEFPHSVLDMNVLYAVSSIGHPHAAFVLHSAKQRGVRIVWNQNGVHYRAWSGDGWERLNARMAALRRQADYVVYQSTFCQVSAERFLGPFDGPSSVLHNPVDVDRFVPAPPADDAELVLIALDTPFWHYRLECAIRALAFVVRDRPRTRLIVPGGNTLASPRRAKALTALAHSLGLANRVTFLPAFTPREAPDVMRQAHVLVHPQYNDACPNLVVEAMACGLPVVYSATGGVPELVGSEGGIGVPGPVDWDRIHVPSAELIGAAILQIAVNRRVYGEAARARAERNFSVRGWTAAHRSIFDRVARSAERPVALASAGGARP
jgi:glycosyltransferase involved in cell wall biosynthesis